MKNPVLSVLMPVYNASSFVADALDSVLASDFADFELICVDDGSEDGSSQLIRAYAERDSRVKPLFVNHAGVSNARNAALREARGDYVTFVDSDDAVTPGFFREMLEVVRKFGVECVVAGWTEVSTGGERVEKPVTEKERKIEVTSNVLNYLPKNSWGRVYSRALIERSCAAFPPGVNYGEDLVFNYCVLSNCESVVLLPSVGYCYLLRGGSLSDSAEKTVGDMIDGGRYLLNYWKGRGEFNATNQENFLLYVAHSMRRIFSYGSWSMVARCEECIVEMMEEAEICPEAFDCLRRKDSRAILSIMKGASGMSVDDYWRRITRRIRRIFRIR